MVLNTTLNNERVSYVGSLATRMAGYVSLSGRLRVPKHVDPETPRVGDQYTLADCGAIRLGCVSTKNEKYPQYHSLFSLSNSKSQTPISISLASSATPALALVALALVCWAPHLVLKLKIKKPPSEENPAFRRSDVVRREE